MIHESDNWLFFQLKYFRFKNEDAQMTIIVPYGQTNLRKIMKNLNDFNASRLSESGFESKVRLSLPKFKINSTINLYHPLRRVIYKLQTIKIYEMRLINGKLFE